MCCNPVNNSTYKTEVTPAPGSRVEARNALCK